MPACHVILHILDPRFLSKMESHEVASIICLADNSCHVILHILGPRFLSLTESRDVVSIICQALHDVGA